MYSIHLKFADLKIGKKFQSYCHRDGIYCAELSHHNDNRFHVTTEDETFFERLKRLVAENNWLNIV